jgi:transposase InsO family protein
LLGVVHSDVCGPFEVPSLGGNKYFIYFVNETSRMMWLYLIKANNEAFDVFKRFKKKVENEREKSIKILKTGVGRENTSKEFEKFSDEHGITHEVTAPYTPQYNGIAERRNITIINMVSMLKEKSLSKFMWGEAAAPAVYILNKCPAKRLSKMVPEEKWTRRKPTVSRPSVFCALCATVIYLSKEEPSCKTKANL